MMVLPRVEDVHAVLRVEVLGERGQGVGGDDAAACGGGDAHAGGDGVADAVEVADSRDRGAGEHRWGADGGAVRALVTTEPRFVRRRGGDEL